MATNTSIDTLLSSQVTTGVISQVAATSSHLLNLFGMQPGGNNVKKVGGRHFGYDIFNDSRKVAQLRAPMAPAARVPRQKVGRVEGTFPRMAQAMPLFSEELYTWRPLGGTQGTFDDGGRDYIARQQRNLGQQAANFRLALLAGMLRDSLYYHVDGDNMYLDFTSTAGQQINYRIPSGNKEKLDMLGAGDIIATSWDNLASGVFDDLLAINSAFQQLYGGRLTKVLCGSRIWSLVTNNTDMKGRAGSANKVFETFERVGAVKDSLGNPINAFVGKLTPIPWIEWWIVGDEGLELGAPGSETYTTFLPTTHAVFMNDPSPEWTQMLEGSEPISDGYGKPEVNRMGLYAYTKQLDDPARRELFTIDNAIPALYVPNAIAYGKCVY